MATIAWIAMKSARARLLRPITHFQRTLSKDSDSKEVAESPVKFTKSRAAAWSARNSRGDIKDDSPWFEPFVVLTSVTVFMIYFCVLREENDLDIELNKSLYDRLPGLEKKQLELVLSYNESEGLDTTDIRKRLAEIAEEEDS
ncbi:uncharacterized protein [Hetaerina americana]|uniref:uncharacterized protein isoform X2 n=1 Tax=Hetaerina americana TaxID=62018 RepID=UPI003A7F1E70